MTIHGNGIIHLKLNRPRVFKSVLPQVIALGNGYGIKEREREGPREAATLVYPVYLCDGGGCGREGEGRGISSDSFGHKLSMEDGRVVLVSRLLCSLTAKGGVVRYCSPEYCPQVQVQCVCVCIGR